MPEAFKHSLPPMPEVNTRHRQEREAGTHTGWKWWRFRKGWIMRHPLCADCDRLAQCVHHVVPRHAAPERMYDESNLVSLCNACHEARHNHPNSKDLRH